MGNKFCKNLRIKAFPLLFGYLPLLSISYLFFSRQILAFPIVTQVIAVLIAIASMIIVIRSKSKSKREIGYSSKRMQLIFIFATGGMAVIGIFRGLFAMESYQRFIGYLVATICFIIMILLILGLKYYDDSE